MKIWVLPIEPLEERYSAQWLEWTERFLYQETFLDYEIINPSAYDKIVHGAFLDSIGTSAYKSEQITQLIKHIHNGEVGPNDVIWVHDGWFPGIEHLAYIRDCVGIPFKIYAMFHAGTYDPNDFLCRTNVIQWGKRAELLWLSIYDGIFVATRYHKDLIGHTLTKDYGCGLFKKIHVTGFPFMPEPLPIQNREKIVVFPHRLDPEKQPYCFDLLKELCTNHPTLSEFEFIRTKDVCKTKAEYYELLSKSTFAVSFAKQETWGIAMQEATYHGCVPIVPDRLSYTEMYPEICRYKSTPNTPLAEAQECMLTMASYWQNVTPLLEKPLVLARAELRQKGDAAFSNMLNIMSPSC